MRCDRTQALMDRYVNEGLPPDEREPFESHLRDCRECQQQLAKLRGLLTVLRSVSAPPVPEGFVGRVMARAQEVPRPRPLGKSPPGRTDWQSVARGIGSWWGQVDLSRLANAVAAVAAGLLLGLVLGQQTWRFAASRGGADRPATRADAEMVYALDYLSVSPRGSFTDSYLSLTSVAGDTEF